MSNLSLSLYLSSGLKKNLEIIEKAAHYKIKRIFMSLQIPEDDVLSMVNDFKLILSLANQHSIQICADVSERTLKIFNCNHFIDLYELGIPCLRIDYGGSVNDLCECAKHHELMLNATTITEQDLMELEKNDICKEHVVALHNYYPKPHTGVSLEFVKQQNDLLHRFGIRTISFLPGHKLARGPLYCYLPTVESHRYQNELCSAMELIHGANSDEIMIGDIEEDEEMFPYLKLISEGNLVFKAQFFDERYRALLQSYALHDRFDSSMETIRIQQSRIDEVFKLNPISIPYEGNLKKGSVFVSNIDYGRYVNEIEIAKVDLPHEPKVNKVAIINEEFLGCFSYVNANTSVFLIE